MIKWRRASRARASSCPWRAHGVDTPIFDEVDAVINHGKSVESTYRGLLREAPGHEVHGEGGDHGGRANGIRPVAGERGGVGARERVGRGASDERPRR